MVVIQYPSEVLPRAEWKNIIDTSNVLKCCSSALLGHVLRDEPQGSCIDYSLGEDRPQITMKAMPIERIPNLSCSLLGAYFRPEHFAFLPASRGAGSWCDSDGSQEELLSDDGNFQSIENRVVVAWKLSEVHNRILPYKRDVDYKMYSDIKSKIAPENGGEMSNACVEEWEKLMQSKTPKNRILPLEGHVMVNHAPIRLNYWHFTIDLYPHDNSEPIKDTGKKWRNSMALVLREYLRLHFVVVDEALKIPSIEDKTLWEKEK